jgi:hypothetical protein
MTESTIVLLVCLAVIALMAILIYVSSRGQSSALSAIGEVRRTLDQIVAGGRNLEHMLTQQRSVLNDAHRKIHAVTKGLEKPLR